MQFHMLCGIPGSGKSTLAQSFQGFVVSTDSIRKFLWNDESEVRHDKLVFEVADSIIQYMLASKSDVIFDATNLTVERRRKYVSLAKNLGAKVTVHWVNCPVEVALHHNARRDRKVPVPVIKALHKSLQPPTSAEGMDKIIIYTQDLSVSEEVVSRNP